MMLAVGVASGKHSYILDGGSVWKYLYLIKHSKRLSYQPRRYWSIGDSVPTRRRLTNLLSPLSSSVKTEQYRYTTVPAPLGFEL